MAIDLRAKATCNLGALLGAEISDSYIQEAGLILTRGSCTLAGVVTPTVGEKVYFQYEKNGLTRRIPRTLRVLSSFADPYRKITRIELGCVLTYMSDTEAPIAWDQYDDPENSGKENEPKVVVNPIHAKSVFAECLSRIGVTSASIPLQNKFSISEFDFSSGYVDIMSNLLVSEGYCGYLDTSEVLQFFSTAEEVTAASLLSEDQLIDISEINVGRMPADNVFVEYSSYKLKSEKNTPIEANEGDENEPDQLTEPRWGDDYSTSVNVSTIALQYQDQNDSSVSVTYNNIDRSETITSYKVIEIVSETGEVSRRNVVSSRRVTETKTSPSVISNIFQQFLSNNIPIGVSNITSYSIENFEYNSSGEQVGSSFSYYESFVSILGSLSVDFVYNYVDALNYEKYTSQVLTKRTVKIRQQSGGVTNETTWEYVPWYRTQKGQVAMASIAESISSLSDLEAYLAEILGAASALVLVSTNTTSNRTGFRGGGSQEAPLEADIINSSLADPEGNPDNDYKVDSVANLAVVTGDPYALTRIVFQLPYAPDDTFSRIGTGYTATSGNAGVAALNYGRIQHKILYGSRFGATIQVPPEVIPTRPFSPVFLEATSTIALYRSNGLSWQIDDSGVIASFEALYWGMAGRTA